MREEFPQSFPLQDSAELEYVYINSELEKAGINLQQISINSNVITVTTDKKVPEETMSNIREDAKLNGFTVKFLTSGEKY